MVQCVYMLYVSVYRDAVLQVFVSVFFAVLIGIIYRDMDTSYPAGLQNRYAQEFLYR